MFRSAKRCISDVRSRSRPRREREQRLAKDQEEKATQNEGDEELVNKFKKAQSTDEKLLVIFQTMVGNQRQAHSSHGFRTTTRRSEGISAENLLNRPLT